uniref:COesterase domain-containing protein n=1 Tax=Steinernema glaseri TaxID=37863 RepID=A0A1I7Z4Y7_9BILA
MYLFAKCARTASPLSWDRLEAQLPERLPRPLIERTLRESAKSPPLGPAHFPRKTIGERATTCELNGKPAWFPAKQIRPNSAFHTAFFARTLRLASGKLRAPHRTGSNAHVPFAVSRQQCARGGRTPVVPQTRILCVSPFHKQRCHRKRHKVCCG